MHRKRWTSGYYYSFLLPDSVDFCKHEALMRISFLVVADEVDSAHYYSCVQRMRGRDIFNVYTDTLSHYNSPTCPQSDCVSCRNERSPRRWRRTSLPHPLPHRLVLRVRTYPPLWRIFIHSLDYISAIFLVYYFFPYMNIALIQTPTCSRHDCPFNAMKYISCKARTSFIYNKSFAPSLINNFNQRQMWSSELLDR